MKHARIQFIQTSTLEQPWNLPFLTDLENDVWNIETSRNIFKFSFFFFVKSLNMLQQATVLQPKINYTSVK